MRDPSNWPNKSEVEAWDLFADRLRSVEFINAASALAEIPRESIWTSESRLSETHWYSHNASFSTNKRTVC